MERASGCRCEGGEGVGSSSSYGYRLDKISGCHRPSEIHAQQHDRGVGTAHHLRGVILAERAVKVKAVRISCMGDQAGAKLFPRRTPCSTSRVTTPSRSLTPLTGLGLLRRMEAVGKPKVAALVMVMTPNTNPDPSRTTETYSN